MAMRAEVAARWDLQKDITPMCWQARSGAGS